MLFNKYSQLILIGRLYRGGKMGKKSVDKMSFGGTNISIGGNVKGVRLKYFSRVENSTSKYLTSCKFTYRLQYRLVISIVRKGVPAPLFLRHPPLDPTCPPFLKFLCRLYSFLFHPLLRYFRQPPTPNLTQIPPALIQPTSHPTNINRLNLPVHLLLSIKNQF